MYTRLIVAWGAKRSRDRDSSTKCSVRNKNPSWRIDSDTEQGDETASTASTAIKSQRSSMPIMATTRIIYF
jgi:hypothetical protein